MRSSRTLLLVAALFAASAAAGDIEGTIVVHRRLSKKKVTAPVSSYTRGTAVELEGGAPADPLAYERSRVVVYLVIVICGQVHSPAMIATKWRSAIAPTGFNW